MIAMDGAEEMLILKSPVPQQRQIDELAFEAYIARIAGFVRKADAVGVRNALLPTDDVWGRRQRQDRIDDAVWAGQITLQRASRTD